MIAHTLTYDDRGALPRRRGLGWSVIWIMWQVVRLPALAVLVVLEPFVNLVLTAFGFLGIVIALIFKFSGEPPQFPFWMIMAFSIGAILMLMAYHALIDLFSS